MKYLISNFKNSTSHEIEISNTLDLQSIQPFEKFYVSISESHGKKNTEAYFLHNYSALVLNENVYFIQGDEWKLKKNFFQRQIFKNGRSQFQKYSLEIKKIIQNHVHKKEECVLEVLSPMTGKMIQILKNNHDVVKIGEPLFIIEAMKMENKIVSESEGRIENLNLKLGQNVSANELLCHVVPIRPT